MTSTLPKSFKAAVFKEKGAPLTIEERELKHPEAGQVLIKVEACGVCHSDMIAKLGMMGDLFPIIPGHEAIGRVVEVGPGEKHVKIGDRVGGPWHGGHDGVCKPCKKGLFHMCENEAINGITRDGGCRFPHCILRKDAGG
jgi:D-arabinose 1-dehydrogenase-like Zn-dependent alcohol dehydrogenase